MEQKSQEQLKAELQQRYNELKEKHREYTRRSRRNKALKERIAKEENRIRSSQLALQMREAAIFKASLLPGVYEKIGETNGIVQL